MLSKIYLIISLILLSPAVYAEYYFVSECNHAQNTVHNHTYYRQHHATVHKHKAVHHTPYHSKKRHINHRCTSGFCANGQYVSSDEYRDDRFDAFANKYKQYRRLNYDNYNNDMATGDDDTYKNPDMQIN